MEKTIQELKTEIETLKREKADLQYMNAALTTMLGPVALEVVKTWNERNVRRVHYSWGPEAHKLTGEERAQVMLDVEKAPRSRMVDTKDL